MIVERREYDDDDDDVVVVYYRSFGWLVGSDDTKLMVKRADQISQNKTDLFFPTCTVLTSSRVLNTDNDDIGNR